MLKKSAAAIYLFFAVVLLIALGSPARKASSAKGYVPADDQRRSDSGRGMRRCSLQSVDAQLRR